MSKVGIGVIGLGNFGKFLIESFQDSKIAEIVAISDNNEENVISAGDKFKIKRKYTDYELLLKDPLVHLVIVATPPFSHYKIAIKSLKAGKHIWLEKPPATTVKQLKEIISLAKRNNLKAFVDFELRYSPIWQAVKAIVQRDLMGPAQTVRLENYASDERLGKDHWFWNKDISGGIFIEHNIHFFDMFFDIFGKPILQFAYSLQRQRDVEDRILAGLVFPRGVWSTVWHSFTRTGVLESTITDIMLERGNLKVTGWIPESLTGHAILTEGQLEDIKKVLPASALSINRKPEKVIYSGSWKVFTAKADVTINWDLSGSKHQNYISLVQNVLSDVVRSVNDKRYTSKLDLSIALAPLTIAQEANKIAHNLIIREK